ncbi:hypothetical protein D3C75_631750 [compost metagenome]
MLNALWLVVLVGVQARGVADAAHLNQFLSFNNCIFEALSTVHSQSWRQFFVSKWLRFVNNANFTNQNLSVSRYCKACQFSNFGCWLTNDSCVQRAVFQDDVLNSFQLFALQHVAAVGCKTFAHCVISRVNNDN